MVKELKIHYKIIITGMLCLTAIYLALLLVHEDSQTIGTLIVGIIAMAIGVIIPTPKINRKGVIYYGK